MLSRIFCQDVNEGYTLYTPQSNQFGQDNITYLIGVDQDTVNTWVSQYGVGLQAYLLPDSTLLYPHKIPNPAMYYSGVSGGFQMFNWEGDLLWSAILSNDTYQPHHDIEPLPNGNFLAIVWERKTAEDAFGKGRQVIDNPLNEMWLTAILELQPIGETGFDIVWEWHLWDHLMQDISREYPNFGVVSEHPELWNINYGDVGGSYGIPNADWMHCNCVTYNPQLDLILLTSRHFDEIYIIDHSTTTEEAAGHSGGNYGYGGDLLYRWGNPLAYNTGDLSDVKVEGPHAGIWIPSGYPGEGNVMVFNNRFTIDISAVFEIILPMDENNQFIREDGQPFGPQEPVWTYSDTLFSAIQSGAYRQPNGNTLITSSTERTIIEVEPDGAIIWQYNYESMDVGPISRARKYTPDYFNSGPEILPGDLNGDEILDVLDIVRLVGIILGGQPYQAIADLNNDQNIDILDVILLVNLILA